MKVTGSMKSIRKIHLIGEVNEDMVSKFFTELDELESKNDRAPVLIELCSEGGTTYDALAIVGRMRNSIVSVHVSVYGKAMSAAVLILAAGDKRSMHENAWVMVHEDDVKVSGSASHVLKLAEQNEKEELQWNKLLEKYTGNLNWDFLALNTSYLTAQECLEQGLIDKIIVGRNK